MANRKEDEKNERIIRNLLKLPDNRRCINCNSLVCLSPLCFFRFPWFDLVLLMLLCVRTFHMVIKFY